MASKTISSSTDDQRGFIVWIDVFAQNTTMLKVQPLTKLQLMLMLELKYILDFWLNDKLHDGGPTSQSSYIVSAKEDLDVNCSIIRGKVSRIESVMIDGSFLNKGMDVFSEESLALASIETGIEVVKGCLVIFCDLKALDSLQVHGWETSWLIIQ